MKTKILTMIALGLSMNYAQAGSIDVLHRIAIIDLQIAHKQCVTDAKIKGASTRSCDDIYISTIKKVDAVVARARAIDEKATSDAIAHEEQHRLELLEWERANNIKREKAHEQKLSNIERLLYEHSQLPTLEYDFVPKNWYRAKDRWFIKGTEYEVFFDHYSGPAQGYEDAWERWYIHSPISELRGKIHSYYIDDGERWERSGMDYLDANKPYTLVEVTVNDVVYKVTAESIKAQLDKVK